MGQDDTSGFDDLVASKLIASRVGSVMPTVLVLAYYPSADLLVCRAGPNGAFFTINHQSLVQFLDSAGTLKQWLKQNGYGPPDDDVLLEVPAAQSRGEHP